jgi:hypothetical protein
MIFLSFAQRLDQRLKFCQPADFSSPRFNRQDRRLRIDIGRDHLGDLLTAVLTMGLTALHPLHFSLGVINQILPAEEITNMATILETARKMLRVAPVVEFVPAQEKCKDRHLEPLTNLSESFALSVPWPKALLIRDDQIFYQNTL